MNRKIKIVQRSINSKILFEKINDVIYESMTKNIVRWTSDQHRASFVRAIEDFMLGLAECGEIQVFKVICDKRNNKSFAESAKGFCFEVHFKQPHCLNTSKIEYHIINK